MRAPALLFVLALLSAGCSRTPTGGAVLVRWRLFDGVAGTNVTRCKSGGPLDSHYCCGNVDGKDITVDRLVLRTEVVHPDGSITPYNDCGSCCFACNPFEHITQFELPLARYRLSLEAYSCGVRVGHTPAPLLREFQQIDDLVDTNVQEIALFPSDTAIGCLHGAPVPTCPPPIFPAPVPDAAGDAAFSFDLTSGSPELDLSLPD